MTGPVRVLALWSPDWPVTAAARAAHVTPERPAAVVVANRVLACSAVARAAGVRRGLRRREAQARCPELVVLARDTDRDARLFEPVVAAVEELAPGVEVIRPGLLALPVQGPAGWFGGELAAAERLVDQVAGRAGVECQAGIAEGLFGAVLAARRGVAVAPGDTPAFLAPLGVEELDREPEVDRSELVGLLRRLGLRSLGAFGALAAGDVASRFGADAVLAHRLARGLDPRPPVRRWPPAELAVELELDPPVDRVDAAAFAARTLAQRLHGVLAGHGLSCTRLGVGARTVAGEELRRVWRCAEPLTPSGTADRVRWQLDSWLVRGGRGAVDRLRLVPEETVAAGALQLGLWGDVGEADERAGRALVRVQALLGPEAVVTAVLGGGRDPAEQVRLVPWGRPRCASVVPPDPSGRRAGATAAVARPAARALAGRRPPGSAARGPARRRGATGAPRRPGPAHRTSAHARRRRRAARGGARLGRAVAGVRSGGGRRGAWRGAGCRCSARTAPRSCCSPAPAGGRWRGLRLVPRRDVADRGGTAVTPGCPRWRARSGRSCRPRRRCCGPAPSGRSRPCGRTPGGSSGRTAGPPCRPSAAPAPAS